MGKGATKTAEQLRGAKLLHWNGPNKPFGTGAGRRRPHAELFRPYAGRGDACDVDAPEGTPAERGASAKARKKRKGKNKG